MKKKINIKKCVKTLTIILMVIVVLMVIINIFETSIKRKLKSFYELSEQLVIDETYNTSFSRLSINSSLSDIYIKSSNDINTKVLIYGDKDYISHELKNNTLTINIKEKDCYGICFKNIISKVEIYLPKEYNKVIEIKNEFGNIEIDSFANSAIDIKEEYGDIKINSSNFITVDSEHGNLDIDNVKKARIDIEYGDLNINNVDDIKISNEHGNIKIQSVNEYLTINNEYGDILINNLNIIKNSFIETEYGDINIENTNDIYISAKSDMGKVTINKNNKNSNIKLKLESDHGDIKINYKEGNKNG